MTPYRYQMTMKPKLHFILDNTSHPGNIGAAARAIKTMGFDSLRLVNPFHFPDEEATVRASSAADVLNRAEIFSSMPSALADTHLVLAATVRNRGHAGTILTARDAGLKVAEALNANQNVAFLFGNERNGLPAETLALAHHPVCIPSSPDYYSLNLAAAVQVIAYECSQALNPSDGTQFPLANEADHAPCQHDQLNAFYDRLEDALRRAGYIPDENPKATMQRLRRIYNRVNLEQSELKLLHGMLGALCKKN